MRLQKGVWLGVLTWTSLPLLEGMYRVYQLRKRQTDYTRRHAITPNTDSMFLTNPLYMSITCLVNAYLFQS